MAIRRCFSLFMALILALGVPLSAFAAQPAYEQTNNVFGSHVFIATDDGYVAAEKGEALNSKEAGALRTRFDRYFKNDLVGIHLNSYTTRIAVKPKAGIAPVAIVYQLQENSYKTLQLVAVDSNGFWVFAIPAGTGSPLNIVIANGKLEPGAKSAVANEGVPADRTRSKRASGPNLSYRSGGNDSNSGGSDYSGALFSVTDVQTHGSNTLAVESTASESCYVQVRVLADVSAVSTDWSSGAQIASGSALIGRAVEQEFVSVTVSSSLPQYFVVVASLVDDSGRGLCEPYIFLQHTRAYADYEAQTVHDFDVDKVINLDGDDDTNFVVLKDNVLRILEGEGGYNLLDASGAESGRYMFSNPDSMVSSLSTGDFIAVVSQADSQVYPIQVRSVSSGSGAVTVSAYTNLELSDYFDYIKIDMEEDVENPTVDMSGADPGVVLLDDPEDPEYYVVIEHDEALSNSEQLSVDTALGYSAQAVGTSGQSADTINIDNDFGKSFSFGIKFTKDAVSFSGTVSGNLKVKVKIVYDFVLFGEDFFEARFSVVQDAKTTIQAKVSKNNAKDKEIIDLGKLQFPTGIVGVNVYGEVSAEIQWDINGGVEVAFSQKDEKGVLFGSNGYQPIKSNSASGDISVKGQAKVTVGPKISVGIQTFGEIAKVSIYVQSAAEATGTAVIGSPSWGNTTRDSMHACALCVNGVVDFFIKSGIDASISKKSLSFPGNVTLPEWREHLLTFFASIDNSPDSIHKGSFKTGFGICQNNVYRTIFDPQDRDGNTVSAAVVTVMKLGTEEEVFKAVGKNTQFLYPGSYGVSAEGGGVDFKNRVFNVESSAQTVVISSDDTSGIEEPNPGGSGVLKGDVRDANTQRAVPGASISAYTGTTAVGSQTTNSEGSYEMPLSSGRHRIEIAAPNYIPYDAYITIEEGRIHYMETFLMVTDEAGDGVVTGTIRDATTGFALDAVTLEVREGWGNSEYGSVVGTFSTGSNGGYQITLPYGNYTITASKDDYITDSFNIVVKQTASVKNTTLSPAGEAEIYRVVLTWGDTPRDLDSHLVAPGTHIYYSRRNSDYARLDVDMTNSYGPETITILDVAALGGLQYHVHDYTNRHMWSDAYELANSSATVRLYRGADLVRTYYVPTEGEGTVWSVFSMNAAGQITDINTFGHESMPSNVGSQSRNSSRVDALKDYELEEADRTDGGPFEEVSAENSDTATVREPTQGDRVVKEGGRRAAKIEENPRQQASSGGGDQQRGKDLAA